MIVLEDHEHFAGVKRWHLTFMRGGEQFTSALDVEENVGSEQKKFVFPTELITEANAVFITARDEVGTTLAFGSSQIKIPGKERETLTLTCLLIQYLKRMR